MQPLTLAHKEYGERYTHRYCEFSYRSLMSLVVILDEQPCVMRFLAKGIYICKYVSRFFSVVPSDIALARCDQFSLSLESCLESKMMMHVQYTWKPISVHLSKYILFSMYIVIF